jgi:hypothetical protein
MPGLPSVTRRVPQTGPENALQRGPGPAGKLSAFSPLSPCLMIILADSGKQPQAWEICRNCPADRLVNVHTYSAFERNPDG